jgi:hypothetical protein
LAPTELKSGNAASLVMLPAAVEHSNRRGPRRVIDRCALAVADGRSVSEIVALN